MSFEKRDSITTLRLTETQELELEKISRTKESNEIIK